MRTRIFCALAALLLALSLTAGAAADSPLSEAAATVNGLLFDTDNVTLDGTAEFRLNGVRFKSVKAHYVQDGGDSLWELRLSGPRKSGVEYENGYTIICNELGEYNTLISVMPVYEPGVVRSMVEDYGIRSLVTPTPFNTQLFSLAVQMVPVVEATLPEGAVTVTDAEDGGKTLRLALNEGEASQLLNALLNVVALPVAEHLFGEEHGIRFDRFEEPYAVPIDSYVTVTDGLLWSVTAISLKSADVTLVTDAETRLTAAKGSLTLTLSTYDDGDVTLELDFDGTVGEYGTSHVDVFDPDVYGVEPLYIDD